MKYREAAIIETVTGICMLVGEERKYANQYMEEIMGRPIFTHELADKKIREQLREKSMPDFIRICQELEE